MGNPSQSDRTTPTNFKWKKIRREKFSSEKEELTTSTSKPNDMPTYADILESLKPNNPDVVLVSRGGVEYPAHKSVLCAASSYFRAMFGGAFQEASSDRVVLHSVSSGMLRIIMDSLRLDKLEDKAFEDSIQPIVLDVFHAAYMLDVTPLVKLSCTLLGEGITSANYKKAWAFYETYPTETLYDCLRASFRENYRHFFKKSCLTFDPSFMRLALEQWVPFVNHQILVRTILRWIQCSPTIRERCLDELVRILRPERLPPGLMNFLAAEEETLQRHPQVLQQFQTPETTVDTAQFRREAGYDVIADAISVLFFTTEGDTTTVERVSFSGCREKKVLPFRIFCLHIKRVNMFACVQYKSKIYFVGRVTDLNIDFIEYDFDNNSFVCMDSSPIRAYLYCDAFVVNDRLHVHCLNAFDGSKSFVQFYDFLAGRTWTRVLDSTKPVSLCPYGNCYLTLEAGGGKNATKVTRIDDRSSFTIPCEYKRNDVFAHCNGQIWGCSEIRKRKDVERKFSYDVNKKCFKSKCDTDASVCKTRFMRIDTLQRHPLIVKCEIYPDECYLSLLDTEHDDVPLGQIEQKRCLETFDVTNVSLSALSQRSSKCVRMGMMAYCTDLTL